MTWYNWFQSPVPDRGPAVEKRYALKHRSFVCPDLTMKTPGFADGVPYDQNMDGGHYCMQWTMVGFFFKNAERFLLCTNGIW